MSADTDRHPSTYRPDRLEEVETGDGSSTLYDPDRDAHYSSLHGARTEARHIFVEGTGLAERDGDWNVLELGFGAGINFREVVRARDATGSDGRLVYHGVDYAPVPPDDTPVDGESFDDLARSLLERASVDAEGAARVERTDPEVAATLHPIRWRDLDLPDFRADVVFFDPFDPKREPDSWREACFEVARRHMTETAVLATYSAASDPKRAMFRAGFAVATAPGPGPKREITYASPSRERLAALDATNLLDRARYLEIDDD